ncbi:MAG: HEAT repeat domain-containing protein [Deltaproteobacteria bacterium]|nr:MAG: HEAT repeat domain-containing protein [Deltaproteobacteria bacterium]
MPPARCTFRLRIAVAAFALVAVWSGTARADKVDTLIRRMLEADDYKLRLSAALNLQKTGDPRAIPAYIRALADRDKTVRGVAAASLGKMITAATPAAVRKTAADALARVAKSDDNAFVRKQAQKAYDAIAAIEGGGAAAKVYVDLGPMADDAGAGAAMVAMMRTTAAKTFAKHATGMTTKWPGGKRPSKRALRKAGAAGFYVDGTITKLDVQARGASAVVSCKVSMLLASYPEKSMFGFLKGSAKVQASNSAKDIGYAKQDCVAAVVEDLVRRKIIPTIASRTP